jgi:proline dehydrogenase
MKKEASRFIAGETLKDAVSRVEELNKKGIKALVDFLGEEVKDEKRAEEVVQEYKKLISEIKKRKLNAAVDLKLTNIGLSISKEFCLRNIIEILSYATLADVEVWIDAELRRYKNSATEIYLKLHKKYPKIYLTVQSYLKDSYPYIEKLIHKKARIRLVKGAYKEKSSIKSKKRINGRFKKMMHRLFLSSDDFAIATHYENMLSEALKLQKIYKKRVEFQFLLGLSDMFISQLKRFENVSEYVPYGKDWKGYLERRKDYLKHRTDGQ